MGLAPVQNNKSLTAILWDEAKGEFVFIDFGANENLNSYHFLEFDEENGRLPQLEKLAERCQARFRFPFLEAHSIVVLLLLVVVDVDVVFVFIVFFVLVIVVGEVSRS